ncbi:heavy metal translocating P-type ATPase [Balneolales bacterium ANBcel1]|nr:heavy metal translocating P-type ATPase [Balneolales bacterium ANBcel1]
MWKKVVEHRELLFALLCGGLLAGAWTSEMLSADGAARPIAVYLLSYFFGGYFAFFHMIHSLRRKQFDIDFLMLIAATGAAVLGAWAEGALLLFLFSLGHALEDYAMGRARKAIRALSELAPTEAVVRRGDREVSVPVEELVPGEVIIVRPGERFPSDGFVVKGESSVNQAPITGESVPVDKQSVASAKETRKELSGLASEHRIFAGTINGDAVMEVEVTSRAEDSTLARVIRMVNEAETQKSPTQRFAEKFERYFVPVILLFVALLHFAWVVLDEPFADSFYRAMAVLVAASPCALAISTPSAILSGVARAARLGVLVKGGRPLEQLGGLRALAFDKTGTLTEGRPRVTDVLPLNGKDVNGLMQAAVAIEQRSDHPLARAIVKGAPEWMDSPDIPEVSEVKMIAGKGITGVIDGKQIAIGQPGLFNSKMPDNVASRVEELQNKGRTTVLVREGEHFTGIIGLMDMPRAGASGVIESLRTMGIRRMVMLSGDHQRVAGTIGSQLRVDEAWGDLLPEQKVDAVRKLMEQEGEVAMVGDGVNDAPAMAHATVGIAMGAAGSDVALETADVALMADDLGKLPVVVGLSRRTRQIIRQNIFISLGMIAFLVPFVLFGYAGMGIAVLLHEGSTLVVVMNALRLLGYHHVETQPESASLTMATASS